MGALIGSQGCYSHFFKFLFASQWPPTPRASCWQSQPRGLTTRPPAGGEGQGAQGSRHDCPRHPPGPGIKLTLSSRGTVSSSCRSTAATARHPLRSCREAGRLQYGTASAYPAPAQGLFALGIYRPHHWKRLVPPVAGLNCKTYCSKEHLEYP